MKLELYFAPGACSFVPHVALEAIKAATGQDYEPKMLKLHKGEHLTPEYLALNANGQVPLLVVDGKSLSQLVAICEFLDHKFPEAGLLPRDPWDRAQALSTLTWFNNSVHPTFTRFFRNTKFADGEAAQQAVREKSISDYRQLIERIQAMLSEAKPYFGGTKPNVVDAYALNLYRWGGSLGIDPATIPAFRDYVEKLAKEPAVAAAIERERIPVQTYKPA